MAVDPITLAVVRGRLEEIADEMDYTLYRSAFCPVIAEGHDACHGLYHRDTGETLVQGKSSLPIFVGAMMFAVQAVIDRLRTRREQVHPGDLFIFNDPYLGGTHLQDVKLVKPFFYRGELLFYMAGTGHWVDVGGAVPGGFNARATEFFQEGVMVPPVKLSDQGKWNQDIVDIFLTNSRTPQTNHGDLQAILAALGAGEQRLNELLDRYGRDTVLAVLDESYRRAGQMMQESIAAIPDGSYSWDDWLDNDGVDDQPLRIAVDLTVRGDRLTLDFSRSSPPCRGPLNIAYSTAVAACYVALKHCFPDVPANGGCFLPVEVIIPETTLLNVRPPRPVGGYLEVILRLIGCIFGAMALADPQRSYAAPFGTANCLAVGGEGPAGKFVMFTYFGGGLGANPRGDGLNHGNNAISTATIPPVEMLESLYPVLFTRWALRPDSGGAGQHRGGLGAVYAVKVRTPASCFYLGDRGKVGPFGILGGLPGTTNRITFRSGGQEWHPPMVSKAVDVALEPGDEIVLETPGGGGYGDPARRDPALVARDVRRGYVSAQAAARDYGAALDPGGRPLQAREG